MTLPLGSADYETLVLPTLVVGLAYAAIAIVGFPSLADASARPGRCRESHFRDI
ncbi:hypothetical protein [Amycolatopsis coloradensis]|uniref:hypothetical protein n=1 Tax=Amycolatopsis coloradensis TaxID=76021 RepID=UPI001FC9F929|nr:hypothetical protein [Amycolatopsis coloradensis]